MNVVEMWRESQAQGILFLQGLAELSVPELAGTLISKSTAGQLLHAAGIYWSPTKHPRKQRVAREAALASSMSVDALIILERHLRKLFRGSDEWAVRTELCALTGTVDDIDRAAADIVRRHNQQQDSDSRAHRSLKGGKNTDAAGCRTISVTGPEREMAAFLRGLEKKASALRIDGVTYEQAMYDALMSNDGAPREILTPMVVIGLPDWAKLLRHEGSETIFALTDGTTLTGAELIARLMSDHHLVGLYDPLTGPVNAYQSQRLPSPKQRLLTSSEAILCEWPGCTTSADSSSDHHIIAYKNGGPTNILNLAKLCRLHNGHNDDDPERPRHGRIERINGLPVWVPPDGGPPQRSRHPIKKFSAAELTRR